MKVVILAAGLGSRLRATIPDCPKAMLRINGKPLVQYQVDNVLNAGFAYDDIYIIGGYKMDRIQEHFRDTPIHFIYNPCYQSMNNIYSFLLSEQVGDDLLLINADGLYERSMISLLLNDACLSCLLVDQQKKLTNESMRVKLDQNRIVNINKNLALTDAEGEYIGISKIALKDLKRLYQRASEMIDAGQGNAWYEDVFEACAVDINLTAVSTQGLPWIEIDDEHDLMEAKRLASIHGMT